MLHCDYLNIHFTSKVRTFVGREATVAGPRHFKGGFEAFMVSVGFGSSFGCEGFSCDVRVRGKIEAPTQVCVCA